MKANKTRFHGSLEELRPYGINFLTGESCAYFMRGLCDLNQRGVDLLTEFFGGTVEFRKGSNWNSNVDGKPAIASVMIPPSLIPDLQKYILFAVENYRYAMRYGNELVGFSDAETLKQYNELSERAPSMEIQIFNNLAYQPGANVRDGRNVHAFTGRTV